MGVFDNIFKRLGYAPSAPVDPYSLIVPAKAQPITAPPAWLTATAAAEAYSVPDRSLPEAQLELYQRLTWVQIAVNTVAGTAASTPFNVLSIAGEDTQDIPNHPFELLLRRPNPLQSRAELLEATLAYYALTGNAYWWLNKSSGAPTELWVLPPHMVKPVPDGRMYLRGYIYEPEPGKEIPLEISEVVHFRRFHPLNSFVGLSPIEALAVVATGDMAAQKWNTNFFSRDNAKVPGILGFRDPIPDPDWDRMKRDVKEQYGGTNRSLMMMRGMGDGVQWITTAMSQGDMQFLEGRTFTKEEIFAIYAPGLSSVLAVNATEANSVSGKRTFVEYGVWPHLVRIAEKITNDLLPLYGQNLVGEFEDIRVTDKQMELSEIAAYSQTHTVDEVRARYYQDDPLGDDRGNLLVPEIGKGLTPADPNPEPPPAPIIMGQPGQMVPAKPDQTQQDQADQEDTNDAQDMPDMGQMQAEGRQGETGRQQEVKALRRWLRNRGDKADPLKFRRVHLSADDVLDIAGDMGIDAGQEADTEHPPFAWMTGRLTRDGWLAVKALQLQLDPGEDDAAERVITELERRGEAAILRAFREQWRDLLPPNAENMELGELMAYINSRLLTAQPTQDAIARVLYDAAGAGVNIALDQLERIGVGFDYTLVNTRAQDWAKRYSGELITNINDTTKQAVQQAVERWYGNGEPLSALIDDLQPAFSKKRARLIAQTETTRSAAEGARAGFKESGVVTGMVWKTSNDERVCPVCGALNGAIVSIDGGAFWDAMTPELQQRYKRRFETPPAHPGCRCRIAAQVLGVGETRQPAQQQAQEQRRVEPPVAVQPVQTFKEFDGIDSARTWGDSAFLGWNQSLSKQERKAFEYYQSSEYRDINAALRAGEKPDKEQQSIIKNMDAALDRAAIDRDVVAYRGFSSQWHVDNFEQLKGTIITDKAYVSTSVDKAVGEKFVGYAQEEELDPILAEIRLPKGAKAAYVNTLSSLNEHEVIVARGTQYRVVDTSTEDGVRKIILEALLGN